MELDRDNDSSTYKTIDTTIADDIDKYESAGNILEALCGQELQVQDFKFFI